jgi:hypothetical protein
MVSGAGAGAAMGVPRQSFEIDDSQETIQNTSPNPLSNRCIEMVVLFVCARYGCKPL